MRLNWLEQVVFGVNGVALALGLILMVVERRYASFATVLPAFFVGYYCGRLFADSE